jgi:hypothetical protein
MGSGESRSAARSPIARASSRDSEQALAARLLRPLRSRPRHQRARRQPTTVRHTRRSRPGDRGPVRRVEGASTSPSPSGWLRSRRPPPLAPGRPPSSKTSPISGAVDLDPLFEHADVEALTVRSYDGLDLDTRPVLTRSDLYARREEPTRLLHPCRREGDVRVLCNIEPNERWTETMLHEFGHAVYDRELDDSLPWLLATRPRAHDRGRRHALRAAGTQPRWLTTVAGIGAADRGAHHPPRRHGERPCSCSPAGCSS